MERQDARGRRRHGSLGADGPQAIERWLQICEKEGTDGNEPVTTYTLKLYKYFAEFMRAYPWDKNLDELQAPDIVQFRSWLLTNCPSRYLARKTLTYFQTVLNEMALRGHVGSNVAAGITVGSTSRYEQPVRRLPSRNSMRCSRRPTGWRTPRTSRLPRPGGATGR